MQKLVAAFAVFLSVLPTAVLADDDKGDQAKIQGTWEVTQFVVSGTEIPEEQRQSVQMVFKGDRMELGSMGREKRFTFKLDASKKPKCIDMTPSEGDAKGKAVPGIYELDGNTLRLCLPNQETGERPKEFKSAEGSKLILVVLRKK